ncbi:MAG: STAS-like domain-containing protein [Elusimicrobiota bacterium]|jgi:hypothetical protein|nr:STAS-like domain-containing protein [Elusimicrobiota bacterium]
MKIQISKFGNILVSRPAGKDAFLTASAYIFKEHEKEFVLDFAGVEVLTPSWADEFIGGIKNKFKDAQIKFDNTLNPSVKETLEIIKQ